MENISDEKLLEFIDGTLVASENEEIKNLIKEDQALSKRYSQFLEIHQMLKEKPLMTPSTGFVDGVIYSLSYKRSRFRKSGLILFIAALSVVILGSIYIPELVLNLNLEPLSLKNFKIEMPGGIDLKQLNIILLSVLSFISLLLFEKTVLKPLFKR
ncbi:MAG: hypothetical protein ABJH05_17480 [Fulvivirga sp.]